MTGANQQKFTECLKQLNDMTASRANDHATLYYKQFKPMNLLPVTYASAGQVDKMKEFILKFVAQSGSEVTST